MFLNGKLRTVPNFHAEAFKEVADPILARQHGVRALGADELHPAVS
jgi:hypothetical protein